MKSAKLIVRDHQGATFTVELSDSETLIGRSHVSDVRLTDPSISRDHAAISWEGDHYTIEDLQTTNGTRLNGKRVRSGELADGDVVQIGQTSLTFRFA